MRLAEGPITIKLPKPGDKKISQPQESAGKFVSGNTNGNTPVNDMCNETCVYERECGI